MSLSHYLFYSSFGVLLLLSPLASASNNCDRHPYQVQSERTPGDNGYKIKISGNPDKYVPGEVYTLNLQGRRTHYNVQKFIGFMLDVEAVTEAYNTAYSPQKAGLFQLYGGVLTMYSEHCRNAVVQTSNTPKSEIQVLWTAPPAGSGCVRFRAMVQESRDLWYMDDGELTKEMCEEVQESFELQEDTILECSACDEAKYEVTFEGLWSRQTHPKDFPANEWLTHFSDIIGASHSNDYRVWEYGSTASAGLKQVAEWGSTRTLESELKRQSDNIRTIIKARGLWHPNVNGKTFAVFRVDSRHHLMSVVSMLGPSPDWIVGVSALELCLSNGSWIAEKTINLYPYDAGTDSGLTYTSADIPTNPPQRITKITNSYPNDEKSPFYDPKGGPMKPLARLTITRQRVYEKSCSDTGISLHDEDALHHSDEDANRPECAVTQWSEFSACSVTCGQGLTMRSRSYILPVEADRQLCRRQLEEKEMCAASIPYCEGGSVDSIFGNQNYFDESICALTSWTPWSTCSVTCGEGFVMRTRHYLNRMGRKKCNDAIVEKEPCPDSQMDCLQDLDYQEQSLAPECVVTRWSDWSPCSVTCGVGTQSRSRLFLVPSANQALCGIDTIERRSCNGSRFDCAIDQSKAEEICTLEKKSGPCRGYFKKWYYDMDHQMCIEFIYGGCRGNENNFDRQEDCMRLCQSVAESATAYASAQTSDPYIPTSHSTYGSNNYFSNSFGATNPQPPDYSGSLTSRNQYREPRVNCKVTRWTRWSECSVSCGGGLKYRRRTVSVEPQNGGRACPKKLERIKKCSKRRCPSVVVPDPYNGLQSASQTLDANYTFSRPRGSPFFNTPSRPVATTEYQEIEFEVESDDSSPDSDCVMGPWSTWSPCTQSCGREALQQRSRSIVSKARGSGRPCGNRLERRYCSLRPCLYNRG